jgi:uncharacterized membrane protein YebE (DUF533 family)
MNEIIQNKESFSFALALLNKFYSDGVFNEKEREKIAQKLASKYGFKSTSIIVSKSLITTLNNESICMKEGSEIDAD